MSISYKVIQRPQPGVAGGGEKKYYAAAVTNGERDINQLTTFIEKISTVSGADIRAVLYALVDAVTTELSEGRIVRMGDLGYFRVSLSSKGLDTEEEVTSAAIKDARIIFTPGPRIKTMLETLKYEKA